MKSAKLATNTIRKGSVKMLQQIGFEFVWAYSAYQVCVHYKGNHLGTWETARPYGIPRREIIDALGSEVR